MMNKFKNGVPFDPGYSQHTMYFPEAIRPFLEEISLLKSPHQKKFKLSLSEPAIHSLINNSASFYLGCILWGAFIHYKFKENPKKIIDNPMEKLSEEELKSRNYTSEVDFILKFIEHMDKDFKYFLKKPFKVEKQILDILNAYNEFITLNDNFINIRQTNDICLPDAMKHLATLDNNDLDNLYSKISTVIESGKLENLLELGFYNKSK